MNQDEIAQQLQTAIQAYQGKDLDGSEAILMQILSLNPKEPNALHLLGCIHKDRGQLQQAVDLIQASIREDDSNPIPFINLGNIFVIVGQHENAASIFQQSLQRNQQIPEAWFCLGNALRQIGSVQEAKQAFRNTLLLNDAHNDAASSLGALLADEENFDESEEVFTKAIEANPQAANLRINYGKLLEDKHEHKAALEQYRYALLLEPESPKLHLNMASTLKKEGNFEEAIVCCRKAIELNPGFADAYFGLGIVLKENGELDEAKANYRKAIDLKPTSMDAYFNLANILKEQGKAEEAISSYRKAIQVNPDFADVHLNLGNLLKELGNIEDAISSCRRATEVSPDYAEAYYQLYLMTNYSGDYNSALIALQECLKADKNHYNARQSIGYAFFQAGRREEAIKYYFLSINEFNRVNYAQLFSALEGRVPAKMHRGVNPNKNLIAEILLMIGKDNIVAFGDSHVNAFKCIEGISVNYVGAATAYNLASEKSSSGGGNRVKKLLDDIDPGSSAILLCFGEIDCRAHIVKQAYLQKKSIKDISVQAAKSYFDFALELQKKGFNIIIYGPYGSGSQFNSFGLEEHRNLAVKYFNCSLIEHCLRNQIYFFSLNSLLVNPSSLSTRRTWLTDDVHLPEDGDLGAQTKALLLSHLLLSVQSHHQKHIHCPIESNELCIRDVHAFGVSRKNKLPLLYAHLSEHGLLQWNTDTTDSIERIVFDLGSSIVLDSAIITLKSTVNVSPVIKFEIDGCHIDAFQSVIFNEPRVIVDFGKETFGRFLSFFGDNDLSSIRTVSFIPVPMLLQ